jgi:small subunit ribosomal protein S6e
MPFKINIADKSGKTYKLELETEELNGKELGQKIPGKMLLSDLDGYEFEITGASDKSGFTAMADVQGSGLKKRLLSYGKGMHKKPKREGKKKVSNPKPGGLRLRRTVRGRVISQDIIQINLKPVKEGAKPLSQVFPDQNKAPETASTEAKPEEKPAETPAQ